MFPLISNWRVYVAVLLVALGGVGGWKASKWLAPEQVVPAPVTNTVVVDHVVTRTVTVTKAVDGTTTTTTTDTTDDHSSNTSKPTEMQFRQPRWSVDIAAGLRPYWPVQRPDWTVMGYHRLGETNAWAGAGYRFGGETNAILLGVRVDF